MCLWPGLSCKYIFGVFRAQGTCPVAANVILPQWKELTALPQIPWLNMRDHFKAGKERGKIKGKGRGKLPN